MSVAGVLPEPTPAAPPAEPRAIRACLTSTLAAEFDHEWRTVLDRVRETQELADLHHLLNKWRHIAYQEMCDPGAYYRMLAKAEQIIRAGANPDAVPVEDMQAVIRRRTAP